ncbi:hypothetical protein [Clostridium tagluense]|uniref:Uncharacterized protein n=1 Tax=Clostridium tagluense TaxID=360422 RepID=A0A401UUL4_9CLOT|nr:hypothetical protein [Clostridium tagluense]GCD13245.1 hypothetical protein Ctaglu_48680 [Clostridium tagluense]
MGEPKKLELTIEELIEIAIALNENTIANRTRSKEDKIPTDKLIKGFGINRKNFSVTIQDTDIKYNKSTFLYDIPGEFITKNKNKKIVSLSETDKNNNSDTKVKLKSETLVIKSETVESLVSKPNNESETLESLNINDGKYESASIVKLKNETQKNKVDKTNKENEIMIPPLSETFVSLSETALASFDKRIKSIEEMRYEIEEMSSWYKEQRKKENIIDIEISEIKIDKERLNEEPSTRGFKVYPSVIAEFKKFSKTYSQYTMQDLMAMAMIEYIDKYKK